MELIMLIFGFIVWVICFVLGFYIAKLKYFSKDKKEITEMEKRLLREQLIFEQQKNTALENIINYNGSDRGQKNID